MHPPHLAVYRVFADYGGRVKNSEGEVRYSRPQVRNVDASSLKWLRELLGGRSEALERLPVEMYARGCSTRDIEAISQNEDGNSLPSRTAVSPEVVPRSLRRSTTKARP